MDRIAELAAGHRAIEELTPVIAPLAKLFHERGERLYLVGGSVRDAFLGRLGNDLDFTTSARPEVVQAILEGYAPAVWDTGIEFGTVSAEKDGQQIEITTFRADSYDGVTRNPEVTFGSTLEGDLVRRDFAVNAMAVEFLTDGTFTLHDPQHGFDDLMAGVLDTPSTPEQSFSDDPLRMLRAARFASQLEFDVAPRVRQAMEEMAPQIRRITAERVRAELDKLILGAAPWVGIDLLVDTGLADEVYPEISALKLEPDEHMRHKDVYAHSLTVLRQAIAQETDGPDLVLRWSALLHDIGKPDTRAPKPGGGVTFHQHEVVGARLARRRMRKLKYSKQMVAEVSKLISLHMRFYGFGDQEWSDSGVRRYITDAGDELPRLQKLVRSDCTTRNKKKADRLHRSLAHLDDRIAEVLEKEDLKKVLPAIDGNEIMEILGLEPGPKVGKAWKYMKELRLERGPMERDEAVHELLEWWKSQQ